jgi:hypothetical protein
MARVQLREVKVDNWFLNPADVELVGNRTGDHIAGREFRHSVVLGHVADEFCVPEVAAFAGKASGSNKRGAFFR